VAAHGRWRAKTQPIVVSLDPRVRIAPMALAQLNTLGPALYRGGCAAHRAFNEAKALAATLGARSGPEADSDQRANWKPSRRPDSSATSRLLRRGGGPGDAVARSGEQRAASRGDGHAGGRGRADAAQLAAATAARTQARRVLAQWAAVKAKAGTLRP
jgi:hypothetical protein